MLALYLKKERKPFLHSRIICSLSPLTPYWRISNSFRVANTQPLAGYSQLLCKSSFFLQSLLVWILINREPRRHILFEKVICTLNHACLLGVG